MKKLLIVLLFIAGWIWLTPLIIQAQVDTSFVTGKVEVPVGNAQFNQAAGSNIGLVFFISNILKLLTVVAGLFSLVNFTLAGFKFIGAQGDSGAMAKVQTKITQSIFGLILIVVAYTATGLVGLMLFGKADFFLNPQIPGPNP